MVGGGEKWNKRRGQEMSTNKSTKKFSFLKTQMVKSIMVQRYCINLPVRHHHFSILQEK